MDKAWEKAIKDERYSNEALLAVYCQSYCT